MFCFLLNWRKNSNYFKIAVWRSDSMKWNFGGFIFTIFSSIELFYFTAGASGANVIPILPSSTSMDEMKQKMGKLFQKPSGQPFWKKWPKIYIRHLVILAINIHCYFYTIIHLAPQRKFCKVFSFLFDLSHDIYLLFLFSLGIPLHKKKNK